MIAIKINLCSGFNMSYPDYYAKGSYIDMPDVSPQAIGALLKQLVEITDRNFDILYKQE